MKQALGKVKVIAVTVGMAQVFGGSANAAVTVDEARAKAIAWLLLNQKGDGRWRGTAGLDVVTTATTIDARANAGLRNYSFAAAADWLASTPVSSMDSLAQQAASLSTAGVNVTPVSESPCGGPECQPGLGGLRPVPDHAPQYLSGAERDLLTVIPL